MEADSHPLLFEQCPFSLVSLLPSLISVGELMKVKTKERDFFKVQAWQDEAIYYISIIIASSLPHPPPFVIGFHKHFTGHFGNETNA